jgi:sarcosine oxidase gamma subunit
MSTPGVEMLTAQISAIKGYQLSADKRQVSIILTAKHVGDLSVVISSEQVEQLASIISQVKAELPSKPGAGDNVQIRAPKTWLVSADLKIHDVVIIVFDRQTESQTGYALEPTAAKGMAEALVKNADAVLQKKNSAGKDQKPVDC